MRTKINKLHRVYAGFLALGLFLGLGSWSPAQELDGIQLVKPSLVANADAVVPGQTLRVGVLLEMADGWHTYWQYTGDSGTPTTIDWNLPDGFSAGEIEWPLPTKFLEPGDLEVYGYKNQVLLLTEIEVPETLDDSEITLEAHAEWLVCEKICIHGYETMQLTLPVAESATPDHEELFARFEAKLPLPFREGEAPFEVQWEREDSTLRLSLEGLPADAENLEFFPIPADGEIIGHPSVVQFEPGEDAVSMVEIPVRSGEMDELTGVVAFDIPGDDRHRSGWQIGELPESEPAATAAADLTEAAPTPEAPAAHSLAWYLLLGFLGGLILNVMPCVLPAISLKIFGFIRDAGEEPARIFKLGLAFSAGILAFFLLLAGVIIALQSAGHAVGWAFQFQNPYFILIMCVILLVFALNLFGVYEIILPGSAQDKLTGLSQQSGYGGSFFHGMFATILATPCTAPFLAQALGFAFAQPGYVVLLVFISVAVGMASPYIVLTARPAWMKFLPKPGAWMVKVKQFMGFLLLGTMLWLLWVLGRQKGVDGLIWAGGFLLVLAVACWIKGAWSRIGASWKETATVWTVILVLIAGGAHLFVITLFVPAAPPQAVAVSEGGDYDVTASHAEGIRWEPFSQARLTELREMGYPIFIDFTADWCINCKVNERRVLETAPVREALNRYGIVPMKADFTNFDPEISEMLQKFQHGGVPMYVVYPANNQGEPWLLPELLRESIVIQAFQEAAGSDSLASHDAPGDIVDGR